MTLRGWLLAMPTGDSHGFWAPGDGTLREFDEQFDCGPGRPNSRSRRIIEAMRLLTTVYRAFDKHGFEPKDERQVRLIMLGLISDEFGEDSDT